jgi:hypothetical protein
MSSIKAKVQRDAKAERQLRRMLRDLAPQFRGKPIIQAQKAALKPAKDAAARLVRSNLNTTSFNGYSLSIIEGKHSKKLRPYVVLQAQDKAKPARRLREKYSSLTKTNWYKIEHLVSQGTDGGVRRAGTSVRKATFGRLRIARFNESGEREYIRKPTQGRYFIVQSKGGDLHPVKQIKHPGTEGTDYYGHAYLQTKNLMERRFLAEVLAKIQKHKLKHGVK